MSVVYNLEELRERFKTLGGRHAGDVLVATACANSVQFIDLFLVACRIPSLKFMQEGRDRYITALSNSSPHLMHRNSYTLRLMEETYKCMVLECHDMEEGRTPTPGR